MKKLLLCLLFVVNAQVFGSSYHYNSLGNIYFSEGIGERLDTFPSYTNIIHECRNLIYENVSESVITSDLGYNILRDLDVFRDFPQIPTSNKKIYMGKIKGVDSWRELTEEERCEPFVGQLIRKKNILIDFFENAKRAKVSNDLLQKGDMELYMITVGDFTSRIRSRIEILSTKIDKLIGKDNINNEENL